MITLKLMTPVTFGSETITEINFQEMKGKHVRKVPKDADADYILNLASTLSGVVPKVMDELSSEDAFRVIDVVTGFFPHSLKTMPAE